MCFPCRNYLYIFSSLKSKQYVRGYERETPSASALGRSRHAYFDNCGVYPQCEDLIVEMGEFINSHAKQA